MIVEGVLVVLAALATGRGVQCAVTSKLKASTWFALGSALFFALSVQFPGAFDVTVTLLALAVADLSLAGGLVVREVALRRDQRLSREVADDAVVRELMRDVGQDEARRRLARSDDT